MTMSSTPLRSRTRVASVAAAAALVLVLAVIALRSRASDHLSRDAARSDCHLAQCTGEPGPVGSTVTRSEVAARARQWLGDPAIRYSMTSGHAGPGGWGWYRRDCSGFVSMALRLPDDGGGASTVGLADVVVGIPASRLRPYDLIGRLGPGSAGANGHVQLFLGWADRRHTRVRVIEQGGLGTPRAWPHVASYRWPERMNDGSVLRPYRYVRIAG
ncbi:NlpC/P60 family protein [Jatrophihabitans fulvus]